MSSQAFDHVIVVMFENEYCGLVQRNATMLKIAERGVRLTNYYGTFHPSQTNYIASIAGEQCGWNSDGTVWPLLQQKTIVDLLEKAGVSWKAYMEDYPNTAWNPQWATAEYLSAFSPPAAAPPSFWPVCSGSPCPDSSYFQKHDAFSSFAAIQSQESRWQQIVDLAQFQTDVSSGNLPQYCWITPNIWNDGHYQQGTQNTPQDRSILIDQIAHWLTNDFLGPLAFPGPQSKLPPNTLMVLTFDESDFEDGAYEGPNRIYTVLLGDMIEPGTCQSEPGNHYTLLRTIEENFGLGNLGKNDAGANYFRFLWGEKFAWSAPAPIPAAGFGGAIAAAVSGDDLYLVSLEAGGNLVWQACDGASWSPPAAVGPSCSGAFALATTAAGLLLVYQEAQGQELQALAYSAADGWAASPIALGVAADGAIALAAMAGGGGTMLAYAAAAASGSAAGAPLPIESLLLPDPLAAPFTGSPQSLGRNTAGALALAALGSTFYLVYSDLAGTGDPASCQMCVASYETASFNTVPGQGLVTGRWSPPPHAGQNPPEGSIYVVGEASHKGIVDAPPPAAPTLIAPGSGIAMAEQDGCIRLIAQAPSGFLLVETYALSGVMTSDQPTALEPSNDEGYSSGYGTLMEAGWGPAGQLVPAAQALPSLLAAAAGPDGIYVVFGAAGSAGLQLAIGSYVSGG